VRRGVSWEPRSGAIHQVVGVLRGGEVGGGMMLGRTSASSLFGLLGAVCKYYVQALGEPQGLEPGQAAGDFVDHC